MNVSQVKLKDIKLNPSNPRTIKDEKFKQLVQSIKDFPQMLTIRPIVVNADMIVLGGNMRLRACQEAKLTEVPVIIAEDLTSDQQREFIIKDNVGFGEWDWELLANEWDAKQLEEWGVNVWVPDTNVDMDKFFADPAEIKDEKFKIVLEYGEEDYNEVLELFGKHSGSKEKIVMDILKK
jgi:hypothetical protein